MRIRAATHARQGPNSSVWIEFFHKPNLIFGLLEYNRYYRDHAAPDIPEYCNLIRNYPCFRNALCVFPLASAQSRQHYHFRP